MEIVVLCFGQSD